jgi:hypothetical protein
LTRRRHLVRFPPPATARLRFANLIQRLFHSGSLNQGLIFARAAKGSLLGAMLFRKGRLGPLPMPGRTEGPSFEPAGLSGPRPS